MIAHLNHFGVFPRTRVSRQQNFRTAEVIRMADATSRIMLSNHAETGKVNVNRLVMRRIKFTHRIFQPHIRFVGRLILRIRHFIGQSNRLTLFAGQATPKISLQRQDTKRHCELGGLVMPKRGERLVDRLLLIHRLVRRHALLARLAFEKFASGPPFEKLAHRPPPHPASRSSRRSPPFRDELRGTLWQSHQPPAS